MAILQSNSTFSFKHHLTGEAWPVCRAIYLFILTPLDRRGMASLQSNSTFSVEHHLTGEAFLAWYLHIVRTSTIAKNRHLNIVLQAELFLRTGTYDRPTNTVPVGTCTGYVWTRPRPKKHQALAIDAYPRIAYF